jgi:hypothetical protein
MSSGIIRATMLEQNRWIMTRHWFAPAVKKACLVIALGLISAAGQGSHCQVATVSAGSWEQPAASLADQVSGILGPGQARLTIRNLSTISGDNVPTIRRILEQDLKAHGVLTGDQESANTIRVTLSENMRERLWVAEILEGNETRVVMVPAGIPIAPAHTTAGAVVLNRKTLWRSSDQRQQNQNWAGEQVLSAVESNGSLHLLTDRRLVSYVSADSTWREQWSLALGAHQPLPRDPQGALTLSDDGRTVTAYAPGVECERTIVAASDSIPGTDSGNHAGQCKSSDDPWSVANGALRAKAFHSVNHNFFTGVITPSTGLELPAFYSAALLPRPLGGSALLINGIDGTVEIIENGAMKPVAGARDWGSDFAVLQTGCGAGTQIVASNSGEGQADSLRAYELPAQEALAASAPLGMNGSVMALSASPDGKSILTVVRLPAEPGRGNEYEVDRVTALCN